MCGIAGFTNIKDFNRRLMLAWSLGGGIDKRGGHSIGFASIGADPGIRYARRKGSWDSASKRFLVSAAQGHTTMMHARFATCGDRHSVLQAHPFAVKRNGKTVLYGAHNGILWGTQESAKLNGREHDVDSRELFELLADDDFKGINSLQGYGVITWIEPGKNYINICKLTDNADIKVISTYDNEWVWGSTWSIIAQALNVAEMKAQWDWPMVDVGRVYRLNIEGGLKPTNITGITVGTGSTWDRYELDELEWDEVQWQKWLMT